MNKQEELYFHALSKDRAENANTLEKPSMRGIKTSVVEKYSDQAHFIYELLQNADDACATSARFVLESNRLIFAHNGTRHFSVSNPAEEDQDSQNGTLGDINAITSIANSNKTEASIGKFGVGFKAVFQYTSTPHIYDPEFRFRIDRFIVPMLLDKDFPGRRPNETLFLFPFDHPERNAEEAFSDISDKLQNLSFPLLFLSRLRSIEFEFDDVLGLYGKEIKETRLFEDTLAEHICLTQNNGEDFYEENLWLFSRTDECNREYSVGYFMKKDGHLRAMDEPAFCFFPTKEVTGLNFIIHAPFLLTDSREGIRAGIPYNNEMLQKLANLSADALIYLRDIGEEKKIKLINDDIIHIIPYDPDKFSDPSSKRKVSFMPFYEAIRETMSDNSLLPSIDGYTSNDNAYWASISQLTQLFSNEQLAEIVGNKDAQWVFVSLSRDEVQRNNKALFNYLDGLVKTNINEDAILNGRTRDYYYGRWGTRQNLEYIRGISSGFIEEQSFEWLHSFYKWLSESKTRTGVAKYKPFFVDQDGKAAAAFDKDMHPILFFPMQDVSGYRFIHSDLLKDKNTYSFVVEQIGIKIPSMEDYIYNIILPTYRTNEDIDCAKHFKIFFQHFCKCSTEDVDEFIEMIKHYEFLLYYTYGDPQSYRGTPDSMYLPTPELTAFLETKKDVRFLALNEYKEMVGASQEKQLMDFLSRLGVRSEIQMLETPINFYSSGRTDLPTPYSTRGVSYVDITLEGCKEIIEYIIANQDTDKSVVLWNFLLYVIRTKCASFSHRNLDSLLRSKCHYFYYSPQIEFFTSSDTLRLRENAWIINADGELVSPQNVTRGSLSDQYDTTSSAAQSLLDFLNIAEDSIHDEENNNENLTDSQKEKIRFADQLKEIGITEEDLADIEEFMRQKRARRHAEAQRSQGSSASERTSESDTNSGVYAYLTDDDDPQDSSDSDESSSSGSEKKKLDKTTSQVVKDIIQKTKNRSPKNDLLSKPADTDPDIDQDEYTPASIDYSKRIEKAKQKSAAEIEKIAYFEELQAKAIESPKYSYAWFKTLLELENMNSSDANSNSREISIAFSRVEREPGTKRTLVLRHPDRYIPQFMEDLADIPLILHMGDQTKTIAIEVTNIKSYTLRVKMKNSADIEGIDLSSVTSATIDAKSPVFLLEELRKQFNALGEDLGLDDDYNMQDHLCENIEFVFGPPGTGKTTYLAQNVLIPMMRNSADCKVLVLTPTNKSADVLVRRIMEVSTDKSYYKWLVRFGATGDEEIEQSNIYREKTFDIRTLRKSVTVTTIARFPYDFFMPQGTRVFLHGMNWDYIVIDEASMIPIANIVFPLYKKTPRKFIIAGDPFQIEPITSVDLWKNENIYTMVHLDSFTDPKTVPYQYKVELLTTQYRSIPDIGYVYSHFAYGGILQHYRSADSQRPLNAGDDLGIETFNIIKFPVSKYESIYRCKRLQHSSAYQVYSALFTFEYVSYLSKAIAKNNPDSLFKIGVIAPYRAQSDMIDKLLASEKLPKEVDVQVGTIHSFQGDECDIIFAVFNTPPTISASKEMFLNKLNIVNVSISRARDYLFIVMPDDETENIDNLSLIKHVEQLVHDTDAWNEFSSPALEDLIFGDPKYLENNTFSTSHQNVNVYGLPEKCYEVRTEDTAVDIQIHNRDIKTSLNEVNPGGMQPMTTHSDESKSTVAPNNLDENLIPEELRKGAVDIPVRGAINGWCFLVPYTGKIKSHTLKKMTIMYIPQVRNGQEKMVSVSVVEEDRIIYISESMFTLYENGLSEPDGIELRRNFS